MASLSLFIGDRQSSLKIEQMAYESYYLSQQFRISVIQNNFSGVVDIWCDESAFKQFLAELRQCEELRRGEANLAAMSPQEFSLRIFNTRSKGDFSLHYEIGSYNGGFPMELRGGFELDPSLLPNILRDFEQPELNESK